MQILEKPAGIVRQLSSFERFQDIPEASLQWITDRAEYRAFEEGEIIFSKGDAIDHLQIVLEGLIVLRIQQNGEWQEVGRMEPGEISGLLPFSRLRTAIGYGTALKKSVVLSLHKEYFQDLVCESYELTDLFVKEMINRVRDFTTWSTQNEKLMALGRMSAGLAHELNNPASAMVRSADELHHKLRVTPKKFKDVITMRVTSEQTDQVNAILFGMLKNMGAAENIGLIERETAMDDLLDWLEDHDIDGAEDIAETLVDFKFGVDELQAIHDIAEGKHLGSILRWIENMLSVEKLISEIQDSAGRIEKLVGAIKGYSHMDRGKDMELTNIHDGLISTGIMLKHKIRAKEVRVEKDFDPDLPKIKAFVGELNQVFTNLYDNAIDAMQPGGTLKLKTWKDGDFVKVNIADNGTGIPEEIKNQIFEPFFTTKDMGVGSGMGLDIVKRIMDRHRASITVDSAEGKGTTFTLCFPI